MPLSFVKHLWVAGCSCDLFREAETTYYELRTYDAIANKSGEKRMIVVSGYHQIKLNEMAALIDGWRESYS